MEVYSPCSSALTAKHAYNCCLVDLRPIKQINETSAHVIESLINNVKVRNNRAEHDLVMFLNKTQEKLTTTTSLGMLDQSKANDNFCYSEKFDNLGLKQEKLICIDDKILNKSIKKDDLVLNNCSIKYKVRKSAEKVSLTGTLNHKTKLNIKNSQISSHIIQDLNQDKLSELSLSINVEKNIVKKNLLSLISTNIDRMKDKITSTVESSNIKTLIKNIKNKPNPQLLDQLSISKELLISPHFLEGQSLSSFQNENANNIVSKQLNDISNQKCNNIRVRDNMKTSKHIESSWSNDKKVLIFNEANGQTASHLNQIHNDIANCSGKKKKNINFQFCCF